MTLNLLHFTSASAALAAPFPPFKEDAKAVCCGVGSWRTHLPRAIQGGPRQRGMERAGSSRDFSFYLFTLGWLDVPPP